VSRLVFLGTPPAAVPSLRALVAAGHDLALVVSQPDRRRGRGGALTSSAVKAAALELGLDTSDRLDDALGVAGELGVVVAYGRLIPAPVLDALPMVNVHFSLLPRWRGAAPVERAILSGDAETGVCIMRLEAGLDTGPVLGCRRTAIDHAGRQDVVDLTAALADIGAALLVETLAGGVDALGPGEPQQGEATYAAKLEPDEFHLEWARPAVELERVVRLGRAWTTFRGRRLRIRRARAVDDGGAGGGPREPGALVDGSVVTGAGVLVLEEVQAEGRRPVDASDWWRGLRPVAGERLGASPGAEGGDR
jgi:methionyl-tRNA formyltransferase